MNNTANFSSAAEQPPHGQNSVESNYQYAGVLGFGLKELACFIDSEDAHSKPVLVSYDRLTAEDICEAGIEISEDQLQLAQYMLMPKEYSEEFLDRDGNRALKDHFQKNAPHHLERERLRKSSPRAPVFTGHVLHFDDGRSPRAVFMTPEGFVARASRDDLLGYASHFGFPLRESEKKRALDMLNIDPTSEEDVNLISGNGSFVYKVSAFNPDEPSIV